MTDPHAGRRALAQRHVVEGRSVVARQRKIVATFDQRGLDGSAARALLAQFERVLETFEDDLEGILKQHDK